ncbi:MAG: hypothetical protein AAF798_17870 [Bacteroidota bacterium]
MDAAKRIRFDILEMLFKVNSVKKLEAIRNEVELIYQDSSELANISGDEPLFMRGVKTIRENVTIEEMMAEQNYQPISYEKFRALADKIEWKESLDELLEALSK